MTAGRESFGKGGGGHRIDGAGEEISFGESLEQSAERVQRALHKLDAGTYGYCDMCNTVIDPARMEALPQAILCLSCRQKVKNAKTQSSTG